MSNKKKHQKNNTNKPSLSNPLTTSIPSSLHLTSFHPSKHLFAIALTAIGQNLIRIYSTNTPSPEIQEIRLRKGDVVSYLQFFDYEGKKRKRNQVTGELLCGLKSGKIIFFEQASGEITRELEGHTAPVRGWSLWEEKAWSCAEDGKLKCWDIRTGSLLSYSLFTWALI
jgi:WD40 repeat protein